MAQAVSILIIDDEQTLCNLLKSELEQYRYLVDTADSGETGLDKIQQKRFDLIILDIRMPGMDGLEVLKKIRENDLANKVIMLTGVDELKIARDSLQLGANDFLTKPYDIKTLMACIKRVMAEK
jgi:DNA-binding response OmpR family regulator